MKRKFEYFSKFLRICRDHVTDKCHCYCWFWMPCVQGWNGPVDALVGTLTRHKYGVWKWNLVHYKAVEGKPYVMEGVIIWGKYKNYKGIDTP